MAKVKDFIDTNSAEKDTIYIHLERENADKYDCMVDVLWEGYLKDIPEEYYGKEVVSTGQSLSDNERGINGHYLTISRHEGSLEKKDFTNDEIDVINLHINNCIDIDWEHIESAWRDKEGTLCISYKNGKWYHYNGKRKEWW